MEETDVAKMQELADKVFADLGPPFSRNFGIPLLRPVVMDNSKFVEEFGEAGRDISSALLEDQVCINWKQSFYHHEGREKDFVAASIVTRSWEFSLVYTTPKGEEMWNNPSILGFITCAAKDLQDLVAEQYRGEYNFIDFMEEQKEGATGRSFIGVRAHETIKAAYKDKKWEGPFERAVLRHVCSKDGGDSVFNDILKKGDSKELVAYLTKTNIATLSSRQISIKAARESYGKICEYQTLFEQWNKAGDEMKKMEQNVRNAGAADIAKELIVLYNVFDGKFKFYKEFRERKDDEVLSDAFEHLGEIMVKFNAWAKQYEQEEEKLYFEN